MMRQYNFLAIFLFSMLMLSACGGKDSENTYLDRIEISPPSTQIAKGTSQQLTATGLYSNGSSQNLSTQVLWESSDVTIATISESGLVSSITEGQVTITATSSSGVSETTILTVTEAILSAIEVSPHSPYIAHGTTKQLTATGVYSDGSKQNLSSQVTWETSDETVAIISESGLVTSKSEGSITITALNSNISGSILLTVTTATLTAIEITPNNPSIANGSTQQLIATGVYSDGSKENLSSQVSWETSDETVAIINENGLISSSQEGQVTIKASLSDTFKNISLEVTAAILTSIEVTPHSSNVIRGQNIGLIATGLYSDGSSQNITTQVVWRSLDETIATISNSDGLKGIVTGLSTGNTTIIALLSDIESPHTDIYISAAPNDPISLNITANPNVILNNGIDASTLTVTVQPADPNGSIADGTLVSFNAEPNFINFEENITGTISGTLSNKLTSSMPDGFSYFPVTVNASTQGDPLTSSVGITIVNNFSSVFTKSASRSGINQLGYYQPGTTFTLSIANSSNRKFNLHSFEAKNGNEIRLVTSDASLLNNYEIGGGETVGITVTIQKSLFDEGYSLAFFLSDSDTGQNFSVLYEFEKMSRTGTTYF